MLRSSSARTIRKGDHRLSETLDQVLEAAEAASSKKAAEIIILDVGPLIGITDYFLICSGNNERQVSTIVEQVEAALRERGRKPRRREGEQEKRWVLLDYIDFIVHVFHTEDRQFYELERLWKDASQVPFEQTEEAG